MTASVTVSHSSAQLRKIKKPLIERRRRERINECLNQLKSLVLEALNRDESCYSKMEKADILEMTVAHLQSKKRESASPSSAVDAPTISSQEEAQRRYVLGFNECAKEVAEYLSGAGELSVGVGSPLMHHLMSYLDRAQRVHQSSGENSCLVGKPSGMEFQRPASLGAMPCTSEQNFQPMPSVLGFYRMSRTNTVGSLSNVTCSSSDDNETSGSRWTFNCGGFQNFEIEEKESLQKLNPKDSCCPSSASISPGHLYSSIPVPFHSTFSVVARCTTSDSTLPTSSLPVSASMVTPSAHLSVGSSSINGGGLIKHELPSPSCKDDSAIWRPW